MNTYLFLVFKNEMFSRLYLFYDRPYGQTQTFKNKSSLSLEEKKETFACAIFDKICYVACAINCAGKLICLRACLHKQDRMVLIDKPETHSDIQELLRYIQNPV